MNVQVVSNQKFLNCYLSGDLNAISKLIKQSEDHTSKLH